MRSTFHPSSKYVKSLSACWVLPLTVGCMALQAAPAKQLKLPAPPGELRPPAGAADAAAHAGSSEKPKHEGAGGPAARVENGVLPNGTLSLHRGADESEGHLEAAAKSGSDQGHRSSLKGGQVAEAGAQFENGVLGNGAAEETQLANGTGKLLGGKEASVDAPLANGHMRSTHLEAEKVEL
jgi:hypothetical protein